MSALGARALVRAYTSSANDACVQSTLKFAQRAQHVKNRVRINKQLSVNDLQDLVGRLRKQLAESRMRCDPC